ncbi:hypothetical protein [Proteiniphilum sp. UBA1028]|uniref:hypothetical protein n=1 Tax=Proteiniphilum sp. UBA1028 TaxID=1947251 RepID=UPI000E96F2DD|nr:hypothetical protein [Proteiniphilum sp. UBA1028]HBK41710.1 hypothetical protein [Porphyromonadaceae bacterium]
MRKVVVLFFICLTGSCLRAQTPMRESVVILPDNLEETLGNYLFDRQVKKFMINQQTKKIADSGLSKKDYLRHIAAQVKAFYPYQDKATGAIIDPVYKIEWQYSTPCYALSVGLLSATKFMDDRELLASGIQALDCAISEFHENRCAHHHGEFFIQPLMLALDLYRGFVPAEQMKIWREKIAPVDPYLLYKDNLKKKKYCYNHNVVALAGEYLREKEHISSDKDFFEWHFDHQKQYMSDCGLYIDNKTNPPMVYDEFTRQFLTTILVEGYDGPSKYFYAEKLLYGAWTSLFMQSPYGEVPTGGRSAQHLWNEAAAAVTYEIYATQYARRGMMKEAGAFKRAAHLSIKSISRWKRPDGSGFIVKNRFPIEVMHGYESYSAQSQYNLLACWLMSVAYLYADDSIEELPAPTDVGGYVIALQDKFHKVFANADGNYIEYDYSADPRYNATGLIRIHLKGSNPQLGPSDGIPHVWDNKKKQDLGGELYAVGPAWFDKEGKEHRLAEYTNTSYPDSSLYTAYKGQLQPRIEVNAVKQKPDEVAFEITYSGEFDGVTQIKQQLTINNSGITIKDQLKGDIQKARAYYPMLVFDGEEKTIITTSRHTLNLFLRDGGVCFEALYPARNTIQRDQTRHSFRNGYAEVAYFDVMGKKMTYRISAGKP